MDRRSARAGLLTAAALLLAAAAAGRTLPIREARWQTGDPVTQLTAQPAECLAVPADTAQRRSVAIGRIAFRAPLLLGGQAARAGLSCASCHRNGRGNPNFRFPGISGAPGTADVTSSLMSRKRGDGAFNPVPIPDLAGDSPTLKVPRHGADDRLTPFIRGLIVEEFDGPEPPAAVLDGLAAYVRALSPNACRREGSSPVALEALLGEVDQAVALARDSAAAGDHETARFLLAAARSTLGAVDERFQVSGLEPGRDALRRAAADLRALERAPALRASLIAAWDRDWPARRRTLAALAPRSLFAPQVLRRQLDR